MAWRPYLCSQFSLGTGAGGGTPVGPVCRTGIVGRHDGLGPVDPRFAVSQQNSPELHPEFLTKLHRNSSTEEKYQYSPHVT